MKISYRNYPSLQIYDKQRCKTFINTSDYLDVMEYYLMKDGDQYAKQTVQEMKKQMKERIENGIIAEYFSDKPIYYLSPAFLAAVMHALPQMNQLLVDYETMKDIHEDCVMIFSSNGNKSVMEFSTDDDGHHVFTRCSHEVLSEFYMYDIIKCDNGKAGFNMGCYLNMENGDMAKTSISNLSAWYIFLLFKKYANVETYLIEAGEKQFMEVDFSPIDCKTPEHKAKNEAGINVIVLDSLWYTNICREEGFMVSGHFRLQPCKDSMGHWTRKIIYIAAYEKHGYHRQARIRCEAN